MSIVQNMQGICRSGGAGFYESTMFFVPRCKTCSRVNLQMTLCSYLGRDSLGSLTKYHIVLVCLKVKWKGMSLKILVLS